MWKHLLAAVAGLWLAGGAVAAPLPKIAVTDLAYEEKVEEYFRVVAASSKESVRASRSSVSASSSDKYFEAEGTTVRIDRGELRRFTADIKGEMIKSGRYQVMQGKAFTATKNNEKLFDVISRIKRGDFKGADYVLFGSVSSIDVRTEGNPVPGSSVISYQRSMELVADFSLINTRTFAVKAGFSAMGEGSDVRLVGQEGAIVHFNMGKVVSELSKSLGANAVSQLAEQFPVNGGAPEAAARSDAPVARPAAPAQPEEVMVFTPTPAPAK
ncbi:penicillin-binding protein activator LpoB [Paludibacterium paludis]|uniref:Penicillin-binding protein activator LpoB n=1 Tax=Paludibacterium paludis TaxID=1225769 RepID=A0A918P6F6_9NEIS|nr:penicillin-binding protein activator LpoB [Paludibacterium paludis]GGY25327.1 hypothetical protein GCM10011289_31140 [Paludibacterium paludis]